MSRLAVGLMSGTSADGVSLVLSRFRKRVIELLAFETYPYSRALSETIRRGRFLRVPQLSRLNFQLGEFFARAILSFLRKYRISPSQVAVIGSHGQTIYHGPGDSPRNTLQIGEPCVVAEKTGIRVVADFRTRDIAAGGEGAPLIPYFDQYFFGTGSPRALQNIGGIANVTVVGKALKPLAFDTGPGNCLIDWAVRKFSHNHLQFDAGGQIARRGTINMRAVRTMSQHPYFGKKPPKSTGPELFNEKMIPSSILEERFEDVVATLTYFTAYTIRLGYEHFVPHRLSEVLVSGGGAFNNTLLWHLQNLFSPIPVRSLAEKNIPVQAREPLAFAFFALRALEGKVNHLPEATGARKACVLGKIMPARLSYARY